MLPRLQPPHHLLRPQPLSHQVQLQHRVHAGAPAPHIVVPLATERTVMTPTTLRQAPLAAPAHQRGRAARQPAHSLARNPTQTLPAGIQTGRPPESVHHLHFPCPLSLQNTCIHGPNTLIDWINSNQATLMQQRQIAGDLEMQLRFPSSESTTMTAVPLMSSQYRCSGIRPALTQGHAFSLRSPCHRRLALQHQQPLDARKRSLCPAL